jgi:hypothetical protein
MSQPSLLPQPSFARAASLLTLAAAALGPLASACGGGGAAAPAVAPNASASAASVATASASAAPPSSSSAAPAETVSAAPPPPPPVPTSTVATTKSDATWVACHQSYKAKNKEVSKDVSAMAKACEGPTKMKLVGKTLTGKQADQDKPQSFPFDAKAHHCYRAYAQAADGIKDLDLVMKDSAGVIVGQDSTDDPSPVLLEDGAVCFSKDDKASVVVSVGMGSGSYAVQIWSD